MAIRWLNKDMPVEVGTESRRVSPEPHGEFTSMQLAILQVWREFTDSHGYPPSMREACMKLGFASTNAMREHCTRLISKGAMTQARWLARGIVLSDLGRSLTRARLLPTGDVVQEKRCGCCGDSHFTTNEACFNCIAAARAERTDAEQEP